MHHGENKLKIAIKRNGHFSIRVSDQFLNESSAEAHSHTHIHVSCWIRTGTYGGHIGHEVAVRRFNKCNWTLRNVIKHNPEPNLESARYLLWQNRADYTHLSQPTSWESNKVVEELNRMCSVLCQFETIFKIIKHNRRNFWFQDNKWKVSITILQVARYATVHLFPFCWWSNVCDCHIRVNIGNFPPG